MDLHDRGLDLIDFFRGKHSWRKLLNITSRLPVSSAFVEAQLNDPEYAEWVLAQPERPPQPPRLTDWTPEVAALTDLRDRVVELIGVTVRAANGKPGPFRPAPRPVTAIDRARAQARNRRHQDLVAEVKAAQARWEATRGGA